MLAPFLQLLAPFSPHVAEDLWERLHLHLGKEAPSLSYAPWPSFDPSLLVEDAYDLPVQVNGKLRDVLRVPNDAPAAEIEAAALASAKARPFIEGKTVRKVVLVPRRMVSIVAN